jgi:hypothetical protein
LDEIGNVLAKSLEPLLGIQPNADITALMDARGGMGLPERVAGVEHFRVEFFVTAPTRAQGEEDDVRF